MRLSAGSLGCCERKTVAHRMWLSRSGMRKVIQAGVFWLVLVTIPTTTWAQNAKDLIRLAVLSLHAEDLAVFDESAKDWIRNEGRPELRKLSVLGQLTDITDGTDRVADGLWMATGRAVHAKGHSDWLLVYSQASAKVVRVDVRVSFIGEPLSPSPTFEFRGPQNQSTVGPEALNPCKSYPILCLSDASQADPRIIEFLFATTRQPIISAQQVSFSGDRNSTMTFGAAQVRVPEHHKIGRIELPRPFTLFTISLYEEKPDPEKHFIVKGVQVLTLEEWDSIIKRKGASEALVFVHGFNTSFEESVYRAAQIAWDLQYQGLVVLFSWASRGAVVDYVYDQQSALYGRDAFLELLDILQSRNGIKRVHVIAHSMGNFLVLEALNKRAGATRMERLGELVMAAPDVDRDNFTLLVPNIREMVEGLTLYASSADKALLASRRLARAPRAGDVPPMGPVILPGLETIDVTAVGEDILGLNHDMFATVRSLVNDIGLLLASVAPRRLPHQRLPEIRRVPEWSSEPKYWRYER